MDDIDIIAKYCSDCAAAIGERHVADCDVARCSECGGQYISCDCRDAGIPTVWRGEWPGLLECREFGFYTAPDSVWGYREDLNRLYVDQTVVWDKTLERFVRKIT